MGSDSVEALRNVNKSYHLPVPTCVVVNLKKYNHGPIGIMHKEGQFKESNKLIEMDIQKKMNREFGLKHTNLDCFAKWDLEN